MFERVAKLLKTDRIGPWRLDQAARSIFLTEFVSAFFLKGTCNDLVLMTGEGLRRLLGFARRLDLEPAFRVALAETRKITRGPKPVRALREIGLATDVPDPRRYGGI